MNFSFEGATCALPRLSGDGESMQDQTAHMSGGLLVLLMQADVGRPCLRAHAVYAVCLSSAHTLSGCTAFFKGRAVTAHVLRGRVYAHASCSALFTSLLPCMLLCAQMQTVMMGMMLVMTRSRRSRQRSSGRTR